MTGWNLNANRLRDHSTRFHPRDWIVLVIITALLLLFLSRALTFGLMGNLQILAIAMATVGIVSVGQTLVVLTGGVDLSVGSQMALTGVITAYLATANLPGIGPIHPWVAACLGLAIATGIGWLHGLLITRFQLAPFIVTFGSLSLLRGLAQVISNGSSIELHTNAFDGLWTNLFGVIPFPALLMALLFVGCAFLLRNTRLGRYTYAVGNNESVAWLSGVNVGRTQQIIYATSGFLAGVAGLLLLARIEGGSFNSGENYELLSIAAVIIGGTSLKGGSGGVWGTLAGVLMMSLVSNGLVLMSVPPLWKEAITGALIVAAALIDVQRRRLQQSTPAPAHHLTAPPVEATMTLEDTVKQFIQSIREVVECDEARVYLWDRESEELVDPVTRIAPEGTLAHTVYGTAKPLIVANLRRETAGQVVPWKSGIRSTAALPIQYRKGMIGTIELQSVEAHAFNAQTLESVSLLATQMAPKLEDHWLLESGWLTQRVRECLRNLEDDVYLNHCPLIDWLQLREYGGRGQVVRQILLDALEHTLPDSGSSNARAARRYQILQQTYVHQVPVETICQTLNVSRRQYFYDLKGAIDAVVDFLVTQREYTALRYESALLTH